VERRKVVERDPACCGNSALQAPQWIHSRSLVGGELRETNPCISLWFASLSCFLAYLICFTSIYFGVLPVCVGVIYQGYTPNLVRAKSQEELEVVFAGALCYTGLTSARQRSDRCLLWSTVSDRSNRSPRSSDRWTLAAQVFGDEKLNSVITPIHLPSRWLKVLSIGIRAWCSDSSLTA
jgi:hypothetical protein